jgi:hypothetical protein
MGGRSLMRMRGVRRVQFRGRLAEDGRGIGECCEFEGGGRMG